MNPTWPTDRQIRLRSNFFALETLPSIPVYRYHVSFTPDAGNDLQKGDLDEAKTRLKRIGPYKCRRLFQIWVLDSQEVLEGTTPVFDGVNSIYCTAPLPFDGDSAAFTIEYIQADEFPELYKHLTYVRISTRIRQHLCFQSHSTWRSRNATLWI
jgi:N-terminal domain of argonaute